MDEEIVETNPLSKIKYRNNIDPTRPRVVLSENEIMEILIKLKEGNPNFLHPFIYLIVHTGCRRGEAMKLKWEDVDFETRLIRFRQTKNGTTRQIRMSPRLYDFLRSRSKTSEFVLTDEKGLKVTRGKVQRRLDHIKKKLKFGKDWRCHDLRHSFAYNFLKRGGEMYQLKAILGHKSIQMTVDLYGNLKAADIDDPSPYRF